MKITLFQVEATDEKWMKEGIEKYSKRLSHYIGFEEQSILLPGRLKAKGISEQKKEEGKLLMRLLEKYDYIILLDEKGKSFSSVKFARFIEKLSIDGRKQVAFVIGGPFGFSDEMYALAQEKICLSEMTFSHQMVRLFFTEQLYRAFTIIKGEKYHHS